jgi:hypothetical protein
VPHRLLLRAGPAGAGRHGTGPAHAPAPRAARADVSRWPICSVSP